MAKFKKGDKVRHLGTGSDSHMKGKIGTVTEDDSDCPYVIFPDNPRFICEMEDHMELTEHVYKVGDKVRIVEVKPAWEGLLDAVCVVLVNDGSDFRPLKLDTKGWRYPEVWMQLSEVEPAGDVKPYKADPAVSTALNPFKPGDKVRFKDFSGFWQYRTVEKLGTAMGNDPNMAVTFDTGTWLEIGQMNLELDPGMTKGDFAVYTGAGLHNLYYVEITEATGRNYNADFWNMAGYRVSNTFNKDLFRRPTKAELASDKFDMFKPKFKAGDWVKASTHRKTFSDQVYEMNLRYGTFCRYHEDHDKIVMTDHTGLTRVMWLDTCEHVSAAEIAQMPKTVSPTSVSCATVTKAKPMQKREKYIVVLMDKLGRLSPSSTPYQHETAWLAEKEAVRLAETTTVPAGSTFVVFKAVSKAVPPVPAKANLVSL